ncbi:Prosaposin [Frankliniella fusca]|uniref:Prosaposin n=1 Tax=Frankliniella fusca TaxID=407009 RepID=A0AAE1GZL0_9NEOP|nr:Prosaposin [Frankliniella fusca]
MLPLVVKREREYRTAQHTFMARLAVVLCLALVLVLLALTQAAPQVGGPPRVGGSPCTWGPSYWCNNHANANECNVLDWCVEKKMLTRQ